MSHTLNLSVSRISSIGFDFYIFYSTLLVYTHLGLLYHLGGMTLLS